MLHDYLEFQWTVFDACGSWADKQVGIDIDKFIDKIGKEGCLLSILEGHRLPSILFALRS